MSPLTLRIALALLAAAGLPGLARAAMDNATAEQILKDNKCVKCHTVERKKDGPAYRDVAAKFKGEPNAVDKIIHHMTAGEKVKLPDGHEENHKKLKAEPAELRELAQWLLRLEGGTKY